MRQSRLVDGRDSGLALCMAGRVNFWRICRGLVWWATNIGGGIGDPVASAASVSRLPSPFAAFGVFSLSRWEREGTATKRGGALRCLPLSFVRDAVAYAASLRSTYWRMPPLRKYSSSLTVSMRQRVSNVSVAPSARASVTVTV